MILGDLKRKYDAIICLGSNCLPGIQLQKNHLKGHTGPLDWMISSNLRQVSRLIDCGFSGFMELPNMQVTGYDFSQKNYMLLDKSYEIYSAHDFSVEHNAPGQLHTYPQFKEKMKRRIDRLYNQLAVSEYTLFVRYVASLEEAVELQSVLRKVTKNGFHMLIVNHDSNPDLSGMLWGLEGICALTIPYAGDIWNEHDMYWAYVFHGVELSNNISGR